MTRRRIVRTFQVNSLSGANAKTIYRQLHSHSDFISATWHEALLQRSRKCCPKPAREFRDAFIIILGPMTMLRLFGLWRPWYLVGLSNKTLVELWPHSVYCQSRDPSVKARILALVCRAARYRRQLARVGRASCRQLLGRLNVLAETEIGKAGSFLSANERKICALAEASGSYILESSPFNVISRRS
jgi:hypothetical protein